MVYDLFLDIGLWQTHPNDDIPKCGGVYALLIMSRLSEIYEVLYVGSSKNLKQRISSHELLINHRKGTSSTKYKICFIPIENYREYEKAAIRKYQPLANIHHNSGENG